jgi:multiple sugar transport system permease protein
MDAEPRSKVHGRATLLWVLIYTTLGIWTLICLFHFYWVLATSLKGPLNIVSGPFYLPLVDYSPSMEAWRYILFDSGTGFSTATSIR